LRSDVSMSWRVERVIQLLDELDDVAILLGQGLGLHVRRIATSVTLVLAVTAALLMPI